MTEGRGPWGSHFSGIGSINLGWLTMLPMSDYLCVMEGYAREYLEYRTDWTQIRRPKRVLRRKVKKQHYKDNGDLMNQCRHSNIKEISEGIHTFWLSTKI